MVHSVAAALGFSPVPPAPRVADPISQSRKSRRLFPEYACVTSCDPRELPSVPHKVLGPSLGRGDRGLPQQKFGSRSLDPNLVPPAGDASFPDGKSSSEHSSSAKMEVGIYATPEEYVEMARKLAHPLDGDLAVSDWTKQAIFDLLTTHPSSISRKRADFFLKYVLEMRLKLETEEAALHKASAPHVWRVMKGKT